MAVPTPVLFDSPNSAAYYLAFDLLLARAPVEHGRVVTEASKSVRIPTDDTATDARNAAIRVALLKAHVSGSPPWDAVIAEAETEAQRAAHAAGLDSPPPLDDTEIVPTLLR